MSTPIQILFVGDYPKDAEQIVQQLSLHGFSAQWQRVETASEYSEALCESLDLILVDEPLAQFNAIAALQLLRSRQFDIPLIVLTASASVEAAVTSIKQGAADYILKEKLADLTVAVQQALKDRSLRHTKPATKSDVLFRRLVENAPDILYQMRLVFSPPLTAPLTIAFEYISPTVTALTGYEPETFYTNAQQWFSSLHPDDRKNWQQALQEHQWHSQPTTVRLFHKNGNLTWLEVQENPIYDETGTLIAIAGIARDASDRQKKLISLRTSAYKYYQLFESANDAIFLIEPDTYQILEANQRAITFLGYTRDQLLQLKINQISSEVNHQNHQILNTKEPIAFEQIYHHKAGYPIPVEVSSRLIEFNGQQFYQSTVRDLTEHQQLLNTLQKLNEKLELRIAERSTSLQQLLEKLTLEIEQRQQAERDLRASEEKFRQLAENIHQVFWMTECDTEQLLYVNPAYEQIWQRSLASLYQQPFSWLDAIHPDDRERVFTNYHRQLQGEHIKQEYRILHPDGSIRWLGSSSFSILNEQGKVYRIAGLIEDITERKENEKGIHESLIKEKQLNELKSRFVCMTSHEFRTPLSSILTAAELLGYYSHDWDDKEKHEQLQIIQNAVQHMIELLEDVLLVGRSEADQLAFHPISIDLNKFCKTLIHQLQISENSRYIGQHHVLPQIKFSSLSKAHRSSEFKAYLDEKLLRQILSNLLSNALKYSQPNSEIELNLQISERNVIFQVKDSGIGIPKTEISHLFEPFYRCSNAQSISGTGLGLAIVKKSVDLHGGTIEVSSQVNLGTTFTVTLPINYWLATEEI